jgi:hypothetical protein
VKETPHYWILVLLVFTNKAVRSNLECIVSSIMVAFLLVLETGQHNLRIGLIFDFWHFRLRN